MFQENSTEQSWFIQVWPNPAKGEVHVSGLSLNKIETISLLDMSGRIIFESYTGGMDALALSLDGCPPGLCLIRMSGRHGTVLKKLVVQQH